MMIIKEIENYLSLVKFSHTVFALPFALLGLVIGMQTQGSKFDIKILSLVVLCMIFARTAAMAFNRWIDQDIDLLNPRTAEREVPAGLISSRSALIFVVCNCLAFVVTTYFINHLCFYLSPIALTVILGYSLTKRFTYLCHFILGLGLSLAPIGAYIAATGTIDLIPILYGMAVMFWVSGFDIIYALQDEQFDIDNNLKSLPAFLGASKGLILSSILHFIVALLILIAGYKLSAQWNALYLIHWIAAGIFIGLLFYQHRIVNPKDLTKVNLAFFTTNGYASFIFCGLVILDFYI